MTSDQKSSVPIIAGRYPDTGDGFARDGKYLGQFSLTSVLQTESPRPATNNDVVVVVGPDSGRLQIQTWHNLKLQSVNERTNTPSETSSSKCHTTYFTHDGYFELPLVMDTSAVGLIVPLLFENVDVINDLRKGKDGSLIVCQYNCYAGFAFFVPFHHNQSRWYRFKPAAPSPGSDANGPAKQLIGGNSNPTLNQ